MKPGFYTIMAAQFFSSLADNALLVAAIALLVQLSGPPVLVPALKFVFVVSYVVLAAWVGAFADSMPKGRVMFITNTIKIAGCLLMLAYAFAFTTASTCAPGARSRTRARFASSAARLICATSGRAIEGIGAALSGRSGAAPRDARAGLSEAPGTAFVV